MACEAFTVKSFRSETLDLIGRLNAIITEYEEMGFALTLRQLYYQAVARNLVQNTQKEYKRIGDVLNNARLAGLVDWSAIEDRTRNLRSQPFWGTPESIIESAASSYREDLWRTQDRRVEVWIEKDALLGVIEGVCQQYRVPYFACRGNNSQSEQYRAGIRLKGYLASSIHPIVLHLGDHDPNGIDMTRDNRDRLSMFAGAPVEVRRIVLNADQVERYRPPPNFAKKTDSRFNSYFRKFGPHCWELDALSPDVIADLIRREIEGLLDRQAWDATLAEEQHNRSLLDAISGNWAKVEEDFMRGRFAGGAA